MHIEKKSYNYLQIIVDFDDVAKPEKRRRQGGYDDLAVFAHEVTLARFDPASLDLESLDPVIPAHISVNDNPRNAWNDLVSNLVFAPE